MNKNIIDYSFFLIDKGISNKFTYEGSLFFLPRNLQSPGDIKCCFVNTDRPIDTLADPSPTSVFQERYFYYQTFEN